MKILRKNHMKYDTQYKKWMDTTHNTGYSAVEILHRNIRPDVWRLQLFY